MKPEQIRIAIAEVCGWTYSPISTWKERWDNSRGQHFEECPDYLNDLNAIAEAENALTDDQYREFQYQIKQLRNKICGQCCRCLSATAAQRSEAFLKAIGKWKEQ